ncbi:Vacuolar protein sorting-associated protein 13D [Homalodisca vitripennis]|nr:Vacuolar protein sorting-associated protein 13D [Homalodisca vitripennis]
MMQRVEKLYSCADQGKPVLYDTVIQLTVDHQAGQMHMRHSENILLESGPEFTAAERQNNFQVRASVVTPLKVSLSRQQYEQVLETVSYMVSEQTTQQTEPLSVSDMVERPLQDIEEDSELTGVTTLNLDPKLRARMYMNTPTNQELRQQSSFILKVYILAIYLLTYCRASWYPRWYFASPTHCLQISLSIASSSLLPSFLMSLLIWSRHLNLGLPGGLLPSGLFTKTFLTKELSSLFSHQ